LTITKGNKKNLDQ